jgi:hypothetical protein
MDDILRFPSAVKHDRAIDVWLRAQRDELRPLVERWFVRMRQCGGDVRELMHDGCLTARRWRYSQLSFSKPSELVGDGADNPRS